jgi:hypothetical protein
VKEDENLTIEFSLDKDKIKGGIYQMENQQNRVGVKEKRKKPLWKGFRFQREGIEEKLKNCD